MKNILDQPKRAAICGIVTVGGSRRLAAKYVGCHPHTIYNTAIRDVEFRRQLQQSEVGTELTFLSTIRTAGKEVKYWQAAKWALQHMYPEKYARRARTMAVADVKDLISQIVVAVAKVIPDASVRAEVRRQVRYITGASIRKLKEHPRGR